MTSADGTWPYPDYTPVRHDTLPSYEIRWALGAVSNDRVFVVQFAIYERLDLNGHLYHLPNWTSIADSTEDIAKATPLITGSVKWDGCMDWAGVGDVMVHHCDRGDLEALCEAIQLARKVAITELLDDVLRPDEYREMH